MIEWLVYCFAHFFSYLYIRMTGDIPKSPFPIYELGVVFVVLAMLFATGIYIGIWWAKGQLDRK